METKLSEARWQPLPSSTKKVWVEQGQSIKQTLVQTLVTLPTTLVRDIDLVLLYIGNVLFSLWVNDTVNDLPWEYVFFHPCDEGPSSFNVPTSPVTRSWSSATSARN